MSAGRPIDLAQHGSQLVEVAAQPSRRAALVELPPITESQPGPRRKLGASAVGSPFVKYKSAALVADDYSSTFTSRAMFKDLSLLLDCANAAGVPLPVSALVQQLVLACPGVGAAELDERLREAAIE